MSVRSTNNNNNEEIQSHDQDAFKVFVRVRPLNQKELQNNSNISAQLKKPQSILRIQDNLVHICHQELGFDYSSIRKDKAYCFDKVFSEDLTNTEVYNNTLQPLITNILDGFNVTCFAYGMTGAGKTHTMVGSLQDDIIMQLQQQQQQPFQQMPQQNNMGLCIQAANGLFEGMQMRSMDFSFELKVSYLEIYNEQVRDLLVFQQQQQQENNNNNNNAPQKQQNQNLMIVEDPAKGVFVPDLQEYKVQSLQELQQLIYLGNQRRTMAPTGANATSSRSHSILILNVEVQNRNKNIRESVYYSKLQMIDLAGSERAAATENRGQRMVEGANINRSLLALGNCIMTLSDKSKTGSFVPYRDSKLTRLLKDSLGGNTKTIMIACVSPSSSSYEETINTLKYATRARKIKRQTTRNVKEVEMHVSQYKDLIQTLRGEIDMLRGQIKQQSLQSQIQMQFQQQQKQPLIIQNQNNQSSLSISPIRSPLQIAPYQNIGQINNKNFNNINSKQKSGKQTINRAQYLKHSQGNTTPDKHLESLNNNNNRKQILTQRQAVFNIGQDMKTNNLLDYSNISSTFIDDGEQLNEIEQQIFKTQTEKRKLEQEIIQSNQKQFQVSIEKANIQKFQYINKNNNSNNNNNKSPRININQNNFITLNENNINQNGNSDKKNNNLIIQDEDDNYFENLSSNLLSNFEEQWELKQSISELEELQRKNEEQLILLRNEILELGRQKITKQDNLNLQNQIQKVIQFKNNEVRIIEKNHINNIEILNEMKNTLEINTQQKSKLQEMLLKMHSSKKKDLLQVQIEMRKLKLEKTDLYLQNLEMKKQNQQQQMEIEGKEVQINQMEKIIQDMQKQLQEKKIIQQNEPQILTQIKQNIINANNIIEQPVKQKQQNRQSGANQSRAQWGNNIVQKEISKKLVLSGFFEDDYQGEQENQHNEELKDDNNKSVPSTMNIVSTILQDKRKSLDNNKKINTQQKKKGFTPNTRYKQQQQESNKSKNKNNNDSSFKNCSPYDDLKKQGCTKQNVHGNNLSISQISESQDTNQSEVMFIQEFFQNQEQKHKYIKKKEPKIIKTPVAQVNLFTVESSIEDNNLIKNVQQQNLKVLQQSTQNNKFIKYQSIREVDNNNNNNNNNITNENQTISSSHTNSKYQQRRTSRLNRYLSVNRNQEDEIVIEKALINKQEFEQEESEKENHSRNNNSKQKSSPLIKRDSFDQQFNTFYHNLNTNIDNKNNNKTFSPIESEVQQHTIDLRTDTYSGKFEQRKYSQQLLAKNNHKSHQDINNINNNVYNSNNNIQNSRQKQINSHRKQKSGDIISISQQSFQSQTSAFQSYSQIRRVSKDRKLQKSSPSQSYQKDKNNANTTNNNNMNTNNSSAKINGSNNPNLHNASVNSFNNNQRVDFSKETWNYSNKNKAQAAAAATISKYGAISNLNSQINMNINNNNNNNNNNVVNSGSNQTLNIDFSNNKTYFDNFFKKKTQTQNAFSQPNSLTTSTRTGAMKALNFGSPLINSQQSSSSNLQQLVNSMKSAGVLGGCVQQISCSQNNLQIPTTQTKDIYIKQLNSVKNLSEINPQSIEMSMQQFIEPQSTENKVHKNLDDLMKKQKAQLNKDKEKLQKNHTIFTNSFGSTMVGLQQQQQPQQQQQQLLFPPQSERLYQSNKDEIQYKSQFKHHMVTENMNNQQQLTQRYPEKVFLIGEDEFDEKRLESPERMQSQNNFIAQSSNSQNGFSL